MELNQIYNESCLDTLAKMPDAFLDCVVTSPPYYGLRSYQTEPQIWGNKDCDHVWGETIANPKSDTRTPEEKIAQGGSVGSNVASQHWAQGNMGNFCQLCNAWRGELGLEPTFQLYIQHLIDIFREVHRVLKSDGCVFVNLGDSYARNAGSQCAQTVESNGHRQPVGIVQPKAKDNGIRPKSLLNIPHRFFIGMTDELQFIQRNNINWWKRACMPSSAKDRWTVDFESIGFFTKNERYKFNQQLESASESTNQRDKYVRIGNARDTRDGFINHLDPAYGEFRDCQGQRNQRTTWDIPFEPSGNEHYASYPTRLVERMILAGSNEGDIVYDPFGGTATTAVTAHKLGRNWICSELQPKYADIANKRLEPYLNQSRLF